ncbi:MAG: META domain-containing protein [Candidatus Paceibacterota bacterium]|jgi:heat shock protein HslJ
MISHKKIFLILLTLIILGGAVVYYLNSNSDERRNTPPAQNAGESGGVDPKNATYRIEGKSVTLVNGLSVTPVASGSAAMVTTRYFGNEVKHDFDGDGRIDTAFILTQTTGGSGTFYYLVAALYEPEGYVGSEAFLIGDRIAPQITSMLDDPATPEVIVVNFATRKPGESFSASPSVDQSLWLKLDPKTRQFGQVEKDFEGEADPDQLTLGLKTWNWVRTTYNDGRVVTPKRDTFTLTLKADKIFSAKTDCNGVGGEYAVSGNKITFTKMMSTLMFCEGSQEQDYSKMLGEVESYKFTSKGELVFGLKTDTGNMMFR